MRPDQLLAHYERVADAPDALPRLRRFVLDLAVRGKLMPQDPKDEPASELLKRIEAEKARLVKTGTARRDNAAPVAPPDQHAFPIPSSWAWVPATFPAYGVSDLGKKVQTKDVLDSGAFPVVDQGKVLVRGYCDDPEKVITVAAPMIVFGDHTRETKLIDFDFVVGADGVKLLQPVCVDAPYYFLALQWLPLDSRGYGRHFKLLKASALPLPPLAEQPRIVAKVDELMALLDRLAAARVAREAARDRLTKASLARLGTPAPATFRADARFALETLTPLTTRPDQIKHLRQTILNLAVRGKLVEQDPNDEPALELLKRVAVELAEDDKCRRGSRSKPLPDVDFTEAPYELPDGWTWARFPELGKFGRGKSKHRPRNDPVLYTDGTYLMIQTGDVARSEGRVTTYTNKYNEVGLAQSMLWPKGTLCITIAANIADSGILDFDACFPDSVVGFIPAPIFDSARYFEYFVRTEKANLLEFAPATAQKNINLEILTSVLIPLPPLAEQHRIVAEVDALMALLDRLEASLATATTTRHRLLEALLHEALVPADAALAAA